MDADGLRNRLVDWLVDQGYLRDARVEEAFRAVPRHLFLPGFAIEDAYSDEAILTHWEHGRPASSSSQPAIMVAMLEQLDVQPGHRVLEIGAGTGYNAALLAHLTGETGSVITVDIEPGFVEEARRALDDAGYGRVVAVCADGYEGYAPGAPYDRIIVTASAARVEPASEEQLVEGGRLVVPLWQGGSQYSQASTAFEKTAKGMRLLSAIACGFMPMRRHTDDD
jgi:protein-L-isoaspartate(D-aspartate) O-methyltransferase